MSEPRSEELPPAMPRPSVSVHVEPPTPQHSMLVSRDVTMVTSHQVLSEEEQEEDGKWTTSKRWTSHFLFILFKVFTPRV